MNKQYDKTLIQSLVDCIKAGIDDGCTIYDNKVENYDLIESRIVVIADDTGHIPYVELKLKCTTNKAIADKYILLKTLRID